MCAGEYCISGVAGNDRFQGDRLRPATSSSASATAASCASAGRPYESAGGRRRCSGDADVGGAGRRRRL